MNYPLRSLNLLKSLLVLIPTMLFGIVFNLATFYILQPERATPEAIQAKLATSLSGSFELFVTCQEDLSAKVTKPKKRKRRSRRRSSRTNTAPATAMAPQPQAAFVKIVEDTASARPLSEKELNIRENASKYAARWGKKMVQSKKYHPGRGVTYCNVFAVDLAKKIMGADSPFEKYGWKGGTAHDMANFCKKLVRQGKGFDEITGGTLNDRFRRAWEAANEGKLVIFASGNVYNKKGRAIARGHFSTAIPTPIEDFRVSRSGSKTYKVGRVVQAGASMLDGNKKCNGRGGHSFLSNAWRASRFGGIRIYICKGTGQKPLPQANAETTPKPVEEVAPTTATSTQG